MKIVTHLFFDGTCREALEFYRSCLGGELQLMTVGEIPPAAKADMAKMGMTNVPDSAIMHGELNLGKSTLLMANDMMDPKSFTKGDNFTVAILCDSEKEVDELFGKLSAGGKVTMPLGDAFWGARFGSFTDKFGVDWMTNYSKPKKG